MPAISPRAKSRARGCVLERREPTILSRESAAIASADPIQTATLPLRGIRDFFSSLA